MKKGIAALFVLRMALSINAPLALAQENENDDWKKKPSQPESPQPLF